MIKILLSLALLIATAGAQVRPIHNPKLTGTTTVVGPTGTVLNVDVLGVVTINNTIGDNIFTSDSNGQFLDANNGTLSLEIASRSLWDNAFFTALDWQARLLYSSAGVSRLDWSGAELLVPNGNMHLAAAAGASSASKFIYVGDTTSAGITLEKTTATTGKYSFFTRGTGDFGFYDELNARYTLNIRKSDGFVEVVNGLTSPTLTTTGNIIGGTGTATSYWAVDNSGGVGNSSIRFRQAGVDKYQMQWDNGTASLYFYNFVAGATTYTIDGATNVTGYNANVTSTGSFKANSANANGSALLSGLPSDPTNYGGLWFGGPAAAPSATNYTLLGDNGGNAYVNSATNLYLRIANNNAVTINASVVDAVAGLKVASGTELVSMLSNSASLDYASIGANAEATLTLTVTGAVTTNTPSVSLGWSAALPDGIVVKQAWVSAANTVSVRVRNATAGAIDPAAVTCRATVFGF